MNNIHIKHGRLLDPANKLDKKGDLFIADGKIISLGKLPAGFKADEIIDASNQIIIPGIVDICARIREPGLEHKANIKSETHAAASAGVTTLCCPPDTDPVIDEPAVVELIHQKASFAASTKIITLGALTIGLEGKRLSEMNALAEAGCVGVSNCRRSITNTNVLKRAYLYAANCGLPVYIEPNDKWLSENGCAHEGTVASRLGLKGIPVSAETIALARAIQLVAETGIKAHFGRLSSAESINLIRRAKKDGLNITADVSAHQLHLTDLDISSLNSNYHVLPPLRSQRDKEALQQGIADGTIDAICSDHQPHDSDAKQAPFASTEPGISSIETLLPLAMRLVDDKILKLETIIKSLTTTPASILGVQSGLELEMPADITVINPDADQEFDPNTMLSHGKNTPFIGWNFKSTASFTIIDGVIRHKEI